MIRLAMALIVAFSVLAFAPIKAKAGVYIRAPYFSLNIQRPYRYYRPYRYDRPYRYYGYRPYYRPYYRRYGRPYYKRRWRRWRRW